MSSPALSQKKDRIEPDQAWTGRSGMGPDVVVERVDLESGEVRVRRVPTDLMHPVFVTSLNDFCASFRLQ